ncbi:hypothetical protein I546_6303 [Mycobacterium kansasii 732]|nr:hypothetical protein I546_6303 [Mycobacterium kansasii 732]
MGADVTNVPALVAVVGDPIGNRRSLTQQHRGHPLRPAGSNCAGLAIATGGNLDISSCANPEGPGRHGR